MDDTLNTALDNAVTQANRDPLLKVRETTHGAFEHNAYISQQLKYIFRKHNHGKLNASQGEALDLIATKIGRILSGNAAFHDHWDDIAGYAKLGAEACGQ